MSENQKGENFSHPRLKICSNLPGLSHLLTSVQYDRSGGEPLRRNMTAIAEIIGREWRSENSRGGNGVIIGVPRSGVPMSDGLKTVFPEYNYLLSNSGANQDANQPILPSDLTFNGSTNLLIADSVIVTGGTIAEILRTAQSGTISFNQIAVFAAFASTEGVTTLLKIFPELKIDIGSFVSTKQNWDFYRWKSHLTLDGMPNFGELVSRP